MNVNNARIIIAGGGTGGHLFPAIAIADRVKELLQDQVEIVFVGTKRGLEYRIKEKLGYPLLTINIRGIARSLSLTNLMVPFLIIGSLIKVSQILKSVKPDVVIGTGGYVCWPVLAMASYKKITTVLQEQNSFPGLTTRKLSAKASRIYLGFEKAKEYLNTNAKIIVTGNPVRKNINEGNREEALKKYNLSPSKKTILVLGGSQGAMAINRAVLKSLDNLERNDNYQILWQTGKRDYTEVNAKAGNKAFCSLFPFATNMQEIYAAADFVIARAGALTLAEIVECGLPSTLVPYPYAAGDHQKKNALNFVEKNIAQMIDETTLKNTDLIGGAISIMESDEYMKMKDAIKNMSHSNKAAVDIIAEDIIELIKSAKRRQN